MMMNPQSIDAWHIHMTCIRTEAKGKEDVLCRWYKNLKPKLKLEAKTKKKEPQDYIEDKAEGIRTYLRGKSQMTMIVTSCSPTDEFTTDKPEIIGTSSTACTVREEGLKCKK